MPGLIEHIQQMDERSRSRLANALSIAVSIIVLAIWLAYFPTFIRKTIGSDNSNESSFSLLQTVKGGSAMVENSFKQLVGTIQGRLGSPKEYVIQAK